MNFDGHILIKINDGWVLDCTTYRGYKVKLNRRKSKVESYTLAFTVVALPDGSRQYDKHVDDIPSGILRKSSVVLDAYEVGNLESVIDTSEL